MPILGPNGQPISSAQFKKADPPKLGTAFGSWAGRDIVYSTLPGGGVIQFDLSKLQIGDFRAMRDHYQVNASLAVLSFMQHQSNWKIVCDQKKISDHVTENMSTIWTQLNRAMSTANWAGFSPNALEWENEDTKINITKVKDLLPEECKVQWKEVEGWAPPNNIKPKFKVYDGIRQQSRSWPIPVENSYWFPLLMENGDYYGRKLLRPAFQSWFFSLLIHLFANRYYERFGEPTPVGRAPFDDEIGVDGVQVAGNTYMLKLLQDLRNRSVVVLPNDSTQDSNGKLNYDYDIDYLESQMRGADFERYLTRLDEEISIGLFTPILLLRTADVGSYNLGVGHMQMYLWMLNAMNDDRALYINKYLIRPMVRYNFGDNAPPCKIEFQKLGNSNADMVTALLKSLVDADKVKPDIDELGQMAGMTLKEVRATTDPGATDPSADPGASSGPRGVGEPRATGDQIVQRITPQVANAFEKGTFGPGLKLSLGYKRKMERSFANEGYTNSESLANTIFERMNLWTEDVLSIPNAFDTPDQFIATFRSVLNNEIDVAS